jgi:hypothetical protein
MRIPEKETSQKAPTGDDDVRIFIREMTAELVNMASNADRPLLAYLLRLAWVEASNQTELTTGRGSKVDGDTSRFHLLDS